MLNGRLMSGSSWRPIPWAGIRTGQVGDGRTTANWPLRRQQGQQLMPLLTHCYLDYAFTYSTRAEVATQSTPGSNFRPAQKWLGRGTAYR